MVMALKRTLLLLPPLIKIERQEDKKNNVKKSDRENTDEVGLHDHRRFVHFLTLFYFQGKG